jgi:pimeloyl-ACP methyl ester carboxylesterase
VPRDIAAMARHIEVQGLRTRFVAGGPVADPPARDRGTPGEQSSRMRSERSGVPILILHGWGATIETVVSIFGALRSTAPVYALDLPGFGETEMPPGAWGVADYQGFVAAFMDALELGPASVVAHSNGGRIAIRMAATEPHRIAKLVLVDSAGIRPKRGITYYRKVSMAKAGKHAARRLGSVGERLQRRLVAHAASSDYAAAGALRPTFVKLVNEDLSGMLRQIGAPTLLIWGSEDTATPVSDGRLMEHSIPDAGLVVLDGAGHYSYLDQPERFQTILRHFLADRSAP